MTENKKFEEQCQEDVNRIAEELNGISDLDAMYEYLEDVYSIEYRADKHKRYTSVRIMIGCGGPNIFIDTKLCQVVLYWGFTEVDAPLGFTAVNLIDDIYREYWSEC